MRKRERVVYVIDRSDDRPLYQQLYDQVVYAILNRDLPAGSRLMPVRECALDLSISRNTVERAYRMLVADGYASSLRGSGFVVKCQEARFDPAVTDTDKDGDREKLVRRYAEEHAPTRNRPYDFSYGNADRSLLPTRLWGRLSRDVLYTTMASKAGCYDDKQGLAELREQVARYLAQESGVRAIPEQIIIAPGTQSALEIILSIFEDEKPDCEVLMEDPGFHLARKTFQNRGFAVTPFPTDDYEPFFKHYRTSRKTSLIYLTPSAQFPTNAVIPLKERALALEWAEAHGTYLIEDDYCREFRYYHEPIPSLQSMDEKGRVIYLGTVSKALSPSLRTSFIVLPPRLMMKWLDRCGGHYARVPWQTQATLAAFMKEGHWDRHVRRARALSEKKRDALIEALEEHMGNRVRIGKHEVGLHVLVKVLDGRSEDELIAAAAQQGVCVYPTSQYWMQSKQAEPGLILIGFSQMPLEKVEPGIALLAKAWGFE